MIYDDKICLSLFVNMSLLRKKTWGGGRWGGREKGGEREEISYVYESLASSFERQKLETVSSRMKA